MRTDVALRVAAKLFLPFILLFALYVQFHGDFGPGGGFQAGVIAAAAIILYAIVFGQRAATRIAPKVVVEAMVPLGVLIYTGIGVINMMMGDNFLNYTQLGKDHIYGQEWGVFLVEVGVLVTVSGTMLTIFYAFVGRGRVDVGEGEK